ncbi:hypothetical protein CSKR_106998 [Clonorchis sinensis]|uniref:Uncharacterized protein n=1 Tax=Clonorchis sinensis TaxID=79923 RepID=A0A3R7CFU5_CLOSI|nr:hypothetical protein CSKR_106998 [Clonorchis sinensis]
MLCSNCVEKNRSAVTPFGAWLPCYPLPRGSREAEVGFETLTFRSVNWRYNHFSHLAWDAIRNYPPPPPPSSADCRTNFCFCFHCLTFLATLKVSREPNQIRLSEEQLGANRHHHHHHHRQHDICVHTGASLPYNHDLFESLIVNKGGWGGHLVLDYYNRSEVHTPPGTHSGNLDKN